MEIPITVHFLGRIICIHFRYPRCRACTGAENGAVAFSVGLYSM